MEETEEFRNKIVEIIRERDFIRECKRDSIRVGPWEINDFSFCFWVEGETNNGPQGVYIKISKYNLYLNSPRKVLPITEKDKILAKNEYDSLQCLAKFWNNDLANANFVTPLEFNEELNSIITQRVYLPAALQIFRLWNYYALIGRQKEDKLLTYILVKVAKSLARFHNVWTKTASFSTNSTMEKIRKYCYELKNKGVQHTLLDDVLCRLESLGNRFFDTEKTRTLKGLDIRNILMEKHSGKIVMLDPGVMKWDYREADVARFLATLKILYWGSIPFGFGVKPKHTFFEAFLNSYYENSNYKKPLVSWFMLKELFKHWRMVHSEVLPNKPWPIFVKRFVSFCYIDPFYSRQIKNELLKIELEYQMDVLQ